MSGPRSGILVAALCLVPWACVPPGDGSLAESAGGGSSDRSIVTAGGRSDEGGRRYGFGEPATEGMIAAWDLDIGPDGAGLPPGQGSVAEGLRLYETKCVTCHGPTGTEGPFEVLAGRIPGDEFPFATDRTARPTVGSYWPYATTLIDYTRRAMPFEAPGSLTDDEVYALVGAVLYLNDLVPEDAVLDSAAVTNIIMPARDRFVRDDRDGGPVIR